MLPYKMSGSFIDFRRLFTARRTAALVWRSAPGWTLASVGLNLLQGLLPLAALVLMKLIVDAVAAPGEAFVRVAWLVGAAGGVALVSALAGSLAAIVGEAQGQVVTDRVLDLVHAKSLEVDLAYYETPQYHDTLHMVQWEAPHRPASIVNSVSGLLRSGLSLLGVAGLLFAFNWKLALLLFAAVVPGVLIRFRYAGALFAWRRRTTATERRAHYYNWLMTGDAHAKEVRLLGLGALLRERFRDLRAKLRAEKLGLAVRQSLRELVAEVASVAAMFGAFLFVIRHAMDGRITLGDLVMYFQAFQRGQAFLREMLGHLVSIYENNLFVATLFEFMELKPRVREPAHPRPLPAPVREGLAFEDVDFRYPDGARDVLRGASFRIRAGEHVALVGANGAGKTTLVKLLCRLYDPTRGRVTLDGVGLDAFALADLRRSIAVLFQDYAKYQVSARENIWFGNVDLPEGDAAVEAAARRAGADEVIRRLPAGYATPLGKWFDEGQDLSVGEWQKIALARGFVRDAPILVLDEPTSALDARAESEVLQQFRTLAAGRTALIISHRLSAVRMADRILVLHDGRIAEEGNHDDLVRRGGMYAELFELQASRYR
jgi:ATP-binding cassette, subfamily B, bacterial